MGYFDQIKRTWGYIHIIYIFVYRQPSNIRRTLVGDIFEALMHPMKDDAANQHWALASRSSVLAGRMRPDSARE